MAILLKRVVVRMMKGHIGIIREKMVKHENEQSE